MRIRTIFNFIQNREKYPYSLNALYQVIGISKQSVHKMLKRYKIKMEEQEYLVLLIRDIREDHPTMCVRDMYYKINPSHIGRDAFEILCKREGFYIQRHKNYRKTTDSSGVIRFNNKIKGIKITDINQVWQSDITYFEIANRFYYITFIIDAYSRIIVGYNVSNRLTTEQTTLTSLHKAIKFRGGNIPESLILHSDGGGQYYDKDFLAYTKKMNIINSMCMYPWENGIAERINGVIKNNYLNHRNIKSFEQLVKEVDRSVYLYNNDKPHIKLKRLTPIMFEKNILLQKQETTQNQKKIDVLEYEIR